MDARRWGWAGVLAAALAGSGGIAAAGAAAGYGAWEYTNGEYIGVAGATLDRTWRATLEAVEAMGLTVTAKKREGMRAEVQALQPDRTNVEIVLTRQSSDFTRVTVRVGVF